MKRAYSIAAIALALSLLAGYVVYSQRRSHEPEVAPGSKSGIISNLGQGDGAEATETNSPPTSTPAP